MCTVRPWQAIAGLIHTRLPLCNCSCRQSSRSLFTQGSIRDTCGCPLPLHGSFWSWEGSLRPFSPFPHPCITAHTLVLYLFPCCVDSYMTLTTIASEQAPPPSSLSDMTYFCQVWFILSLILSQGENSVCCGVFCFCRVLFALNVYTALCLHERKQIKDV